MPRGASAGSARSSPVSSASWQPCVRCAPRRTPAGRSSCSRRRSAAAPPTSARSPAIAAGTGVLWLALFASFVLTRLQPGGSAFLAARDRLAGRRLRWARSARLSARADAPDRPRARDRLARARVSPAGGRRHLAVGRLDPLGDPVRLERRGTRVCGAASGRPRAARAGRRGAARRRRPDRGPPRHRDRAAAGPGPRRAPPAAAFVPDRARTARGARQHRRLGRRARCLRDGGRRPLDELHGREPPGEPSAAAAQARRLVDHHAARCARLLLPALRARDQPVRLLPGRIPAPGRGRAAAGDAARFSRRPAQAPGRAPPARSGRRRPCWRLVAGICAWAGSAAAVRPRRTAAPARSRRQLPARGAALPRARDARLRRRPTRDDASSPTGSSPSPSSGSWSARCWAPRGSSSISVRSSTLHSCPAQAFRAGPAAVMLAIAAVAAIASIWSFRRRDLTGD